MNMNRGPWILAGALLLAFAIPPAARAQEAATGAQAAPASVELGALDQMTEVRRLRGPARRGRLARGEKCKAGQQPRVRHHALLSTMSGCLLHVHISLWLQSSISYYPVFS